MRVVAGVLIALSLGTMAPATVAAQSRGPGYDDERSGPPPYYTAPQPRGTNQDFDRPPVRMAPDNRSRSYEPTAETQSRPWPPAYGPNDRPPPPSIRRVDRTSPPRSSNYQRFWDDGDDRRRRTTVKAAPPPRDDAPPPRHAVQERAPERIPDRGPERETPRGLSGPVSHVAVGANQMVISIAEYESLQEQARQLQRLMGTRRDFHDDRPARDFRDDGPRRDYGPPREIYR